MRLTTTAAVLALVVVGVACGSDATGPEPAPAERAAGAPQVSRTADAVVRMAEQVEAARARGAADLAGLSTAAVHVRSDGAVEVVLHTASTVTAGQLDELRRLGAEVVATTATPAVAGQPPASLVQLWVPASRIAAVDGLPWVAAVTAPSYGSAGG